MLTDEPLMAVTGETRRILDEAIDAGLPDDIPPAEMISRLRRDVYVFSGYKTHAQLKEAASLLLDDSGKIRPFQDFRKDVWQVHANYNSLYLEAEYIFATGSAEMAARWDSFEQDGDRYNLQYRTAGDDRVRDEHAAMDGTTLPVDDPFWNSYYPPNGWRCRCGAVQVRKGKYPVSDSGEAVAKGEKATTRINKKGENADAIFRFNAGKQQVIFPPHHPYRQVSDKVKSIVESLANGK
jgi:SPP1 gp7 family putative phage head morphogenesis protein